MNWTDVRETGSLLAALPGAMVRAILKTRPTAQMIERPDGRLVDQDEFELVNGTEALYGYRRVVPVVSAAISLLSHTIATCPRYVVDRDGEPRMNHPVTRLLNLNHRRWPAMAVWEYLYRSALHFGVGYAWKIRDGSGAIVRLMPCNPLTSTYRWNYDQNRLIFTLHPVIGRPRYEVPSSDVLLVVGDGYNGVVGLSPISAYAVTMGVLGGANQHLLSTLTNGMHIGGVVESDVEVGAGMGWDLTRIADLRKKLVELFAGTLKAGGVPVMPPGFSFSPVAYNAVDIELIKLLELSIEDVCRIHRVPPRLVYHFRSGVRYSNDAEASNTEFSQYSIRPRVDMLGQMVGSQLLSLDALNTTRLSVRFDPDHVAAGTATQRIAAAERGVVQAGIMTRNEAREYVRTGRMPRLDPVADGDTLLDPRGAPYQQRGGTPPIPSETNTED